MRPPRPALQTAFPRTGTLADRVLAALSERPLHTREVAAGVMGLRGNEGALARTVWALLGDDARFQVSAHGVWSLRPAVPPPARRLLEEDWVVVDVETTGGSPGHGHRITEVAAVRVSGGQIDGVFSTLVNPQRPIPRMITRLTGITDEMVSGAPHFTQVADGVAEAVGRGIFVAHNAPFDWRFVCAEMERARGRTLSGRQLCTVRLSRKLLPQLPSRSLDGLAFYFGLDIASRHRATDDALATAHVLLRLLDMLEERGISDWESLNALLRRRASRRKRTARPRSMESA